MIPSSCCSRRRLVAGGALLAAGSFLPRWTAAAERKSAQIAITLDLEMSRNFPQWEDTHWDYEKGNLNEETKQYTLEACSRVKAAGGMGTPYQRIKSRDNAASVRKVTLLAAIDDHSRRVVRRPINSRPRSPGRCASRGLAT